MAVSASRLIFFGVLLLALFNLVNMPSRQVAVPSVAAPRRHMDEPVLEMARTKPTAADARPIDDSSACLVKKWESIWRVRTSER